MKRRRFLQIVGATALAGRPALADTWQGQAFGGDVAIRVEGALPLAEVRAEIEAIEATFSLYRPSELTALNAAGRGPGSARMRKVLELVLRVHLATQGAFDPTIQALWSALSAGRDAAEAYAKIGVQRIKLQQEIFLAKGQLISLNGIVQGYAADRVADILRSHGCSDCLIDLGEYRAEGGPFRVGVEEPSAGLIGALTLGEGGHRAVATSSANAMQIGGRSHILGPQGQVPRWSTVSVCGESAALCDAASTAFVLMDRAAIENARDSLGLGTVVLVDFDGNLTSL
ncbi:FAD:protein FMN transferase [Sinirhodobacter sp. WL0062]|uniref:FAD:protein FMN transferase n=1 Tax=Rhodobacter flavimaris TaxID=2907145 RepID=A0ABS8YT19_9RHOB|nr:FAD:protein FMN transferase [Sinirhodobacter sp. WL0062]MCE5972240.1 FAD:protein FMN transferase [Sinirhodobacter sp. WL0062]